jgi:hypothetical protein
MHRAYVLDYNIDLFIPGSDLGHIPGRTRTETIRMIYIPSEQLLIRKMARTPAILAGINCGERAEILYHELTDGHEEKPAEIEVEEEISEWARDVLAGRDTSTYITDLITPGCNIPKSSQLQFPFMK